MIDQDINIDMQRYLIVYLCMHTYMDCMVTSSYKTHELYLKYFQIYVL